MIAVSFVHLFDDVTMMIKEPRVSHFAALWVGCVALFSLQDVLTKTKDPMMVMMWKEEKGKEEMAKGGKEEGAERRGEKKRQTKGEKDVVNKEISFHS